MHEENIALVPSVAYKMLSKYFLLVPYVPYIYILCLLLNYLCLLFINYSVRGQHEIVTNSRQGK